MSNNTSDISEKETISDEHVSESSITQQLQETEKRINEKLRNIARSFIKIYRQLDDVEWNYMEIETSIKSYDELENWQQLKNLCSDRDAYYLVIESWFGDNKKTEGVFQADRSRGKICNVLNDYGKRGWEVYKYNDAQEVFYLRRKNYFQNPESNTVSDSEIDLFFADV